LLLVLESQPAPQGIDMWTGMSYLSDG
jgi:hypothetical protein